MPAQPDALADLEDGHIGGDRIENACYLVAGRAGKLDARPVAEFGERIAVTNAAGLHPNADVAGTWFGELLSDQAQRLRQLRKPAWNDR